MTSYSRADRVGGLIQRVLSDILRKEIKDPRLKMTTITVVKMTRDLKLAKIYFATASNQNKIEAAMNAFRSAQGFIKRNLAKELNLRYMPELKFFYDESYDYGAHIEDLLKSLSVENGTNHRAD